MKIYPKIFLALIFFIVGFVPRSIAQPHANFSVTGTSGCAPLVSHFTDLSTGSPVSWHWVFDTHPGDTSSTRNPIWIFNTPGYYDVKLVVTNSAGQKDSLTLTHIVFVATQPVVRFTASDTVLSCPPQTVYFTNGSDTGGCRPYYTWFIDSAHIHTTDASYTFTVPGYYNITLRETDSCGCTGSLTRTALIKIDSLPTPCFSTSDTTPCSAPATVCFSNCTSGGASYLWHFGDGVTDTGATPCHVYSATASYTDTLIAYSTAGCASSLIKPNDIRVGHLSFGFYTSPARLCAGNAFTCYDTTSGVTGAHHLWRFSADTLDVRTDASPSFAYATPGLHTITDSVWDDHGCTGSATLTVTVFPSPNAAFTADNLYRCSPSDTAAFTIATSYPAGAVTYLWDFGDTASGLLNTSTIPNPTHIYDSFGSFSPTLTISDTGGCITVNTLGGYINIAPVWDTFFVNGFADNLIVGCLPDTFTWGTYISPAVPYITDSVVYGDGSYDTTHSGMHSYTIDGDYHLRHYFHLTAASGGCRYSSTGTDARAYVGNPVASTTVFVSADTICPDQTVILSGHCTGCRSGSFWDFTGYSDGSVFVDYWVSRDTFGLFFHNPGWNAFSYYSFNYTCADTVRDSVYIKAPSANFRITQPDCNDHLTLEFSFVGGSMPSSYKWVFGDGDSSFSLHPRHTYPGDGIYTATFYDTSATTGCYNHKSRQFELIAFPTALTARDSVICLGGWANIPYNRAFSNVIDYGDGTGEGRSEFIDYYHQYADTGHYTVTMYVTNKFHCIDTIVQPSLIYVEHPLNDLMATPLLACAPMLVNFHDSLLVNTGIPISSRRWIWTGADTAIVGFGPDTMHIYPEGSFQAIVIDSDANGCISWDSIQINAVKPHAYFSAAYVNGCTNVAMPFFDTNTHVTYLWYWGDGSAPGTTGPGIYHTYSANGTYTDTIIITTTAGGAYPVGCIDTLIRTNYVNISDTAIRVRFNLSDSIASCPPLIALATNATLPAAGNYYKWKYGFDSVTINSTLTNTTVVYNYPGDYTITLIDSSSIGCIDSIKKTVHVAGPRGILSFTPDSVCAPGFVHLHFVSTGITPLDSTYVWFVPPYGGFTTDTPGFYAYYTTPGTYNPYVIIDSNGCQVAVHTHDSIYVYPVSHISVNHPPVTCGYSVQLLASGTPTYLWAPATNLSCTTCANPVANPYTATTYSVIGINIYGCRDTVTTYVVIDTPKTITIAGRDHLCVGKCDTLLGSGSFNAYNWYGAALSCNICTDVVVCPVTTEIYTLVTTDSLGCHDTAHFKVNVEPLPVLLFSPYPVVFCKDVPAQLTALGAATYVWRPNLNISCDSCSAPIVMPVSSVVYSVTATSIYGCVSYSDIPITVLTRTGSSVSSDTTICFGASTQLHSHGGFNYLWINPYKLSDPHIPNPIASPDTTITYAVVISENACFTDTQFVKVTVGEIPVLSLHSSFTIMAGSSIQLNGHVANNVRVKYLWTPADNLTCSECPSPIATPTTNTTYSVTAISTDGCMADTTLTINMFCDNSQVFIPNTFTPNHDGLNEYFIVSGRGISLIKHMRIYDRWGELVFERQNILPNEPEMGWDGTFRGKELEPDVFAYTIEAVCELGEVFQYKGNIALIR